MIKSPIRSKLSLVLAALLLTAFRKVVNADSSYKRLRKSLEAENIEEEKVQNDEENNIVNGGSTLQVLSWFAQFSNDRAAGVLIHESVGKTFVY